MRTLTKSRVMEVSDKIQALLDQLGKEEGLKITMDGGKYSGDTFHLKIKGKLLDESGEVVVSDTSNLVADRAARNAGISFMAPHIIGSVWRFSSSGLVSVIDYSSKNRKYPFIVKVYEDGRCLKASAASFTHEVTPPTQEEFYKWFTIDPEDDAISRADESICDRANDYISCRFKENTSIDTFFDVCADYFDKVVGKESKDREVAANVYHYVMEQGNITMAEAYIRKQIKK